MLKVCGCACWPHLYAYNKHKLAFRSKECIFLGYSSLHKGYKCLYIDSGCIYISHDIIFDEDVFPFARTKSTPSQPQPDESLNLHNLHLENSRFNLNCDHTRIHLPANSLDAEDTSPPESAPSQLPLRSVPIIGAHGSAPEASTPGTPPSPSPAAFDQDGPASAPGSPAATNPGASIFGPMDSAGESSPAHADVQHTARPDQTAAQDDITAAPVVHPYGTRLQHNLRQPKKRTDGTVAWSAIKVPSEPTDYTVAMKDPLRLQAMNEEFQALKKNGTWHLISNNSML
jgi:hypothetical protein